MWTLIRVVGMVVLLPVAILDQAMRRHSTTDRHILLFFRSPTRWTSRDLHTGQAALI